MIDRSPLSLIATVLTLAGVALAGLVITTSPAGAHAKYERSEPADGATLAESPQRVDVWFSQELRRSGGLPVLTVVNQNGDDIQLQTVLDDTDRHHMFAELPPALPAGRYTVIWHTLSDEDGEEAQGAFHFYVGGGPAPGSPAPTVTAPALTPSPPSPRPSPSLATGGSGGGGTDVPAWALALGAVGALALGGSAGWLAASRRR